jgi:hypothetical protein
MYEGTITTTLLAMRNKDNREKEPCRASMTHYNKALEEKKNPQMLLQIFQKYKSLERTPMNSWVAYSHSRKCVGSLNSKYSIKRMS